MIDWKPVAEMPEEMKDGRRVLLWSPLDEVEAVSCRWCSNPDWAGWAYADEVLADVEPDGPEPTHYAEITPPGESDG